MVAYAGPLGNAVTLSAALDASAAGTTWVLASMSVGLAVTLLAAGVVADALGRARVFALGAMVFAGPTSCAPSSAALGRSSSRGWWSASARPG
ncbi:hypothetical protein [Barrientosiimonas endolithica]|nr:hypothetical protein [Barrientosiimonas endolithica]